MVFVAVFLCLSQARQDGQPQLTLSASKERLFVGESAELRLSIHLSTQHREATRGGTQPATLDVPWLAADFVDWFLPAEQWVCRQSQARGEFACRLQGHPTAIVLEPTANGVLQLRWRFRARADQGMGLAFEPVRMRIGDLVLASQALPLIVRQRPADAPPGLFLGVGDLRLEAAVDPAEIAVGEETVLTLTVRGQEDLPPMAWPMLEALEEFRSAFLVEPATETWDGDGNARAFRYRLRPRRPMEALPRISYSCFDPRLGLYQSRSTAPLKLLVKAEETAIPTPPYPPGLVPDRFKLISDSALLEPEAVWARPLVFGLSLILPPLVCLTAWLMRRTLFPLAWPAGKALSGPALETMRRIQLLEKRSPRETAESLDQLLQAYLRERFHLFLAEATAAELRAHLELAEVGAVGLESVEALRAAIDELRFAPGNGHAESAAQLRHRALKVLRLLEASA